MRHLSVSLTNNGALSVVRPDSTGSGTRTTQTGGVLAYTFGPRTDATCGELLVLLTRLNIGMLTTDEWGNYA